MKKADLIKFLTEQLASVADSHVKLISGFAPHQAPSSYDFDGVKKAANALGKGITDVMDNTSPNDDDLPF